MKKYTLPIIFIFLLTACNNDTITLSISASDYDLDNVPVYTDIDASAIQTNSDVCLEINGQIIPAQLEKQYDGNDQIWWIANLRAGETASYTLLTDGNCTSQTTQFSWEDVNNNSKRLNSNGQPVLQYEYPVYDPNNIEATKKPFHHVYGPAGDQLITKGPGGLYTHHRGIFFGYNHVYLENQPDTRIDIWHARYGERSEHEEIVSEFDGPVMGGHSVKILWKDLSGNPFIEEIRHIKAFKVSESETIIDFQSTLSALDQSVRLEGDLQHAGVQFRAAQYVAENAEQTQFIRPDKWDHVSPDDEIGEEERIDLPWNAMNFKIDGQTYTVAYMSYPSNPDGAEMSERKYGRFGEFFPYEISPNNPLIVRYRYWITQESTPSRDKINRMYMPYAELPEISNN